ncbi:Small-conductance mechanosensitive channel [Salinimicrobium catena]|uniref:Small-conductance mechanosensitive channel n=1 Tax=Salinimicrobium catena TaxID=390640 RepID=A0A1H5P208_9FLAO|nr:mechanosensitive ion channel domain-containing protein [Salinimicrobium catena]SDL68536.1 Small-conductance mechanosensitive channel [Salinimicrobium catena]SEF08002.1 Small-conductance mechanosensitive channel [Salinimicrobium catena]
MNTLQQYVLITVGILLTAYFIVFLLLKKLGKDPHNILPRNIASRLKIPVIALLLAVGIQAGLIKEEIITDETYVHFFQQVRSLLLIFSVTWFVIVAIHITKKQLLRRFDVTTKDNLRARKFYTQFNIIERIAIFIVILVAVGISLLTFEGVQEIGVSILTSAGIAGIILGLSAQKVFGTIFAGIQIAIAQPIRIDDVVIVEGEWGRVEEIKLTYVVINIWDKRRLVLPTTYFIEKPFQNWTRSSSDILGTVFIYTDYDLPVDALREELTRLLKSTDLWDGKVNVIQVTDLSEKTMELRALVSAKDSPTAWDLRVYIREKLVDFIKENYPNSLPRSRVILKENPRSATSSEDPLQK